MPVSFFLCGAKWKKKKKKKKKKKEKRMKMGVYWPVKPEWKLLVGGRLWGWYEKKGGGRCWLAGWRREVGSGGRKV